MVAGGAVRGRKSGSTTLASNKTKRRHELADIDLFAHLTDRQLAELEQQLEVLIINGGDTLISEGAPSEALYIVVSGRFYVMRGGGGDPVAEIGTGAAIGEIGFFSGSQRTATVCAARDSIVLRLRRKDFDGLCRRSPGLWPQMAAMLAERLLQITTIEPHYKKANAKTIAVCHAGGEPYPDEVLEHLERAFPSTKSRRMLTAQMLGEEVSRGDRKRDHAVTRWLNDEEAKHDHLFFIADQDLSDWSSLAIRHADLVLFIGMQHGKKAAANRPLNALERYAHDIHNKDGRRLVIVHDHDGEISGTQHWLEDRTVQMHHHVAAGSDADYRRLARFISGEAVGLVACGGGAYCAAHIGMFEAFLEAGLDFDIVGGTSGGAAMVGAFARGVPPDDLDQRTHDIFVTHSALRRATWPRYSLLDHTVFDGCLAHHYSDTRVEDLRIPFFAISTDLSHNRMRCIRDGELWKAIRASSAIPGLLPPVYTPEGDILVDGSLLDNVPVRQMCDLKSGPNVIINFEPPEMTVPGLDYDALPSRGELIQSLLVPFLSHRLPDAPSAQSILTRSLSVNREDFQKFLTEDDLVFMPPIPEGMSIMDWRRHSELRNLAYDYGRAELARHRKAGHKLLQS
jgi:NTE family protein